MNRLTTVLYPSVHSSGSEGSTTANHTPHDSITSNPSPRDPHPPSLPLGLTQNSIYDDPRTVRFTSPPPSLDRAHSDLEAKSNNHLSSRPNLVRRLTDEGPPSRASRTGTSTPTTQLHKGPDRSVRVNVMNAATQQQRKGRNSAPVASAATGRLTCMAKGPRGRYVIGGGQYLRVLEVGGTEENGDSGRRPAGAPFGRGPGGTAVSEVVNLWRGAWGIGKGVNDVDWGVGKFENKIITATPSGNFMLFDLGKGKMDREVTGGHTRPMNCIRASKMPAYAHIVVTGGTEGQVRLWDLRDTDHANRKYYKHNAPVSALALCMDDPHQFVVGTEAGGLFRYDMRVPNKAVGKVWGAHGSKAVMSLKWKDSGNPDHSVPGHGWLASAGGDRMVQVWDMSQQWEKGATAAHVLHTAHPVRGIDWRPNHPTELLVVPYDQIQATASPDPTHQVDPTISPDESDATIEIWDVRRHYVAKYALPGHESMPVKAIWNDADAIVSCYQNGGLVQVDLHSRVLPKTLPLDGIPRQIVAWSAQGELAYALDKFKPGEIPFDDVKSEYAAHWQVGRHRKGISDKAYEPLQAAGVVPPIEEGKDEEYIYMANHYRLEGAAPEKLCAWNREVAEVCGRMDEARMWDFLQGLIEEFSPSSDGFFNESVFTQTQAGAPTAVRSASPKRMEDASRKPSSDYGPVRGISLDTGDEIVALEQDTEEYSSDDSDGPQTPRKSRFKAFLPPTVQEPAPRPAFPRHTTSSSHPAVSALSRSIPKRLGFETPLSEADTPTPTADLDYPDPYGIAAALESAQASIKGTARSTPHSTHPPTPTGRKSMPGSALGSARASITAATRDRVQPAQFTRKVQGQYAPDKWDEYRDARCGALLDWWGAYVEDGEVQVASAMFILGSAVVGFPQTRAERVLDAYLGMLEQWRLVIPIAYVRKFSNLLAAQTLPGQDGITHVQYCSRCGKSTGSLEDTAETKTFWWCGKCRRGAKICTICREPVRGLWMGCNKCRHGGHQRCMRLYYLDSVKIAPAPTPASRAPSPTPQLGRRSSSLPLQSRSLDSDRTEKSRTLGEVPEHGSETTHDGAVINTNVCPTGCGCTCRTSREEE